MLLEPIISGWQSINNRGFFGVGYSFNLLLLILSINKVGKILDEILWNIMTIKTVSISNGKNSSIWGKIGLNQQTILVSFVGIINLYALPRSIRIFKLDFIGLGSFIFFNFILGNWCAACWVVTQGLRFLPFLWSFYLFIQAFCTMVSFCERLASFNLLFRIHF